MPKNKGFIRILKAFAYSFDGLKNALANEAAFRQELLVGIPFCAIAASLNISPSEKAILIASIFLVWIVELLNSAIEECVNLSTREIHPLAKRAKDMGSAAVLISIILALIVWFLILL